MKEDTMHSVCVQSHHHQHLFLKETAEATTQNKILQSL